MEPLYQVLVVCPQCEGEYQTSRVRPSFKRASDTDTDFCKHYKEGNENPDYYVVKVCPHCGFAFSESFLNRWDERKKELFRQRVSSTWQGRDFGGKRTLEDAMDAYKLALVCAQITGESDRVIAGLLHHIACLYRYLGDEEGEKRFLRHALDAYIGVYERGEDEANRARLMYLIGELHRRLKEYHEAVRWFGRVINDKSIMDAGMIRACRDGWARAREDMLAEQMELPEEMEEARQ